MNLEALRTALDSIGDLTPTAPAPAAVVEAELPAPGRLMVGRLARRVALRYAPARSSYGKTEQVVPKQLVWG